jgi:hypothetical protein
LGAKAGYNNAEGDSNVFIGYEAGLNETGSNKLYIANSWDTSSVLIYGDFSTGRVGIGTVNPWEALDVNGTARLRGIGSGAGTDVVADGIGRLWKKSSSRRFKKNIRELQIDPEKVFQLEPVRFDWKETGQEDIGLIAEEVAKTLPDLIIYDNDGKPEAVKYDLVSIYLVELVKELRAENDALKKRLDQNDAQLSELSVQVETILAKQGNSKSGDSKLAIKR